MYQCQQNLRGMIRRQGGFFFPEAGVDPLWIATKMLHPFELRLKHYELIRD